MERRVIVIMYGVNSVSNGVWYFYWVVILLSHPKTNFNNITNHREVLQTGSNQIHPIQIDVITDDVLSNCTEDKRLHNIFSLFYFV